MTNENGTQNGTESAKSGADKSKFKRRTCLRGAATAGGIALFAAGSVAAGYAFPSTNDQNRSNGHPHVDKVSEDDCEITLEFVNDTNALACFEYRIDGEERTSGTSHPVVTGDVIYPHVCVDGRGETGPVTEAKTFEAIETVEIRLALGGERDWDFDWTPFSVECAPETRADCKGGGWETYGFRNQGQCIRYVETGKDSR